MADEEKISLHAFLKLAGSAGISLMLVPLVCFGRASGTRVSTQNKPVVTKRTSEVGPDGVAFLYPTKPKGFVWYINHEKPFDSRLKEVVVLLMIN